MPLSNPAIITVQPTISNSVTPTSVVASIESVSLLSANSNRKGATVWNNGTANLYLELGITASLAAYTVKINGGGYYEIPFGYTGAISGFWDVVNGNALVREMT